MRQPVERTGVGEALQLRGESWLVVGYEGLPGVSERRVIVEREGTQASIGWSEFWMAIEAAAIEPIYEDMADHLPRAAFDDLTDAEQGALFRGSGTSADPDRQPAICTPELDRERNLLDPAFDPAVTELSDRIKTMLDRQARDPARRSRMTLYGTAAAADPRAQLLRARQPYNHRLASTHRCRHRNPATRGHHPGEHRPEGVPGPPGIRSAHLLHRSRLASPPGGWIALGRWLGFLTRGKDLTTGRREAARPSPTALKGCFGMLTATRPGEYVQIDATDTAIHCLFPGLGWARASILIAVDVFSRRVVALRVIAGRADSRDVGVLLYDMALPGAMRAGFPYDYQCYCGVRGLVGNDRRR